MNTQLNTVRSIEAQVVGVSFEGRQVIVSRLTIGEEVFLERDPHNPYDKNAVKVMNWNGQQLGFLDKVLAASLAAKLDHFGEPVSAQVVAIVEGFSLNSKVGIRIQFELPAFA